MYREVRRKDRAISKEAATALLKRCEYGTLAIAGVDGQPYATPLNYAVLADGIYFHCALDGHKLDLISENPRVCFSVVGRADPVYDNSFTVNYESATVFGTVSNVADPEIKRQALLAIVQKCMPEHIDKADDVIAKTGSGTAVYRIEIAHITGKERKGMA